METFESIRYVNDEMTEEEFESLGCVKEDLTEEELEKVENYDPIIEFELEELDMISDLGIGAFCSDVQKMKAIRLARFLSKKSRLQWVFDECKKNHRTRYPSQALPKHLEVQPKVFDRGSKKLTPEYCALFQHCFSYNPSIKDWGYSENFVKLGYYPDIPKKMVPVEPTGKKAMKFSRILAEIVPLTKKKLLESQRTASAEDIIEFLISSIREYRLDHSSTQNGFGEIILDVVTGKFAADVDYNSNTLYICYTDSRGENMSQKVELSHIRKAYK